MRFATILFMILVLPAIGFAKDCKKPENPANPPPYQTASEFAKQQKAAPVLFMGQANKVHKGTRLRAAPCRVSPACASRSPYEVTLQWSTVQAWLRQRAMAPYGNPAQCAGTEPEPKVAIAKKKMYNAGAPPMAPPGFIIPSPPPLGKPGSSASAPEPGKVAIAKKKMYNAGSPPMAPPGFIIPSPPPLGNPGSSASLPEPGKVAIATVKLFNVSSPLAGDRYVPEPPPPQETAQARPGLTIVSPEKGVPVFLLISKKMRQEALVTRYGTLYVETPLAHRIFIGVVPPDNAYHVPLTIIPHFDAAQDIYLQALVGKRLTNLCVLRVP